MADEMTEAAVARFERALICLKDGAVRDGTWLSESQCAALVRALRDSTDAVEALRAERDEARERLDFVFGEWARVQRDDETGERRYRLNIDTGWVASHTAAIDGAISELRDAARASATTEGAGRREAGESND